MKLQIEQEEDSQQADWDDDRESLLLFAQRIELTGPRVRIALRKLDPGSNLLLQILNGKMGSVAPGLIDLRAAVEDCRKLVKQMLAQKGEEGGAEVTANGSAEAGPTSGGVAKAGSREQAYRQLAQAAAVLRQLEPHSPIPYLIQRAVELGSMPFPQLMRALIREQNVLNELTRELGIKDAEAKPSG